MRPLSSALSRLRPINTDAPPDDFNAQSIERLLIDRHLWSTERIEDFLATARAELAAFGARAEHQLALTTVERLEQDLELARWRDRVLATRPPGCWCLGIGGSGQVGQGFDADGEPLLGWRVWCRCQDARDMRAQLAEAHAEAARARNQAILDRLFGSLPSGFREWTLETLAEQTAEHARLAERMRLWLDDGDRWLYLHGPVGRGKTGAVVAAIQSLAKRGFTSLFVESADLLRRLRAGYSDAAAFADSRDVLWDSLYGVQALVIDDIGAEYHRQTNASVDWATEQLWTLISARHRERRRTLLTSNHSLESLSDVLGHPRVSSRIGELALVLDFSALPNLRKQ